MESHILKHAGDRSEVFQPNEKLNGLITQLRELLEPLQLSVDKQSGLPKHPVIGIVGCPRSGTTFMTQLLAATGSVSFPTNLLSRFAYAPHIGALIQQLLLNPEYDLGEEFADLRPTSGFSSNVGKTHGALGINEFFHFWRRFFPVHDPGHLSQEQLDCVDIGTLRQELASIQAVYGMPFMSKVMMLQYNLAYFMEKIPELKIVHVQRDPLYLMQSVTQARLKYYGTDKIWWSVKPKEYSFLKDAAPATQVAGQVLYTENAIQEQLAGVSKDRWITASYEDVCANPRSFLEELAQRFSMPELIRDLSNIESRYTSGNSIRLSEEELEHLMREYRKLRDGRSGVAPN
ncbi:sulfotransferase [Marinobacter sp.]|uniref:sulfotransferase n=1 Tax=Marinobacter sp. TaxID=50741 RepID=UPI003568C2AB